MRYYGITWDHPRGYNALAAAAKRLDQAGKDISIHWHKHPLEGFESHPIEGLCERYDLVIMDHPHVGEAVRADCLVPLEELLPAATIAQIDKDTIGPSVESYLFEGRHWALPLDAATQVMAVRPDLFQATPPNSWQQVLQTAVDDGSMLLSLAGPHAILTYFSLCVSQGEAADYTDRASLFSDKTGTAALEMLLELSRIAAPQSFEWNPIQILDAMSAGNDFAWCPLIFGYVNYSDPKLKHPIRFHNAPVWEGSSSRGSVLGGTGIAVSRRCEVTPALIDHIVWLMSDEAQSKLIPANRGQPSRRTAWEDEQVNVDWGNFYRQTAETMDQAYIRPRHDGYIRFQTEASQLLREGLMSRRSPARLLSSLRALFERSCHGWMKETA